MAVLRVRRVLCMLLCVECILVSCAVSDVCVSFVFCVGLCIVLSIVCMVLRVLCMVCVVVGVWMGEGMAVRTCVCETFCVCDAMCVLCVSETFL